MSACSEGGPADLWTAASWVLNGPVFRALLPVLFAGALFQITPRLWLLEKPEAGSEARLGARRAAYGLAWVFGSLTILFGLASFGSYVHYIQYVGPSGTVKLLQGPARCWFQVTSCLLLVQFTSYVGFHAFLARVKPS